MNLTHYDTKSSDNVTQVVKCAEIEVEAVGLVVLQKHVWNASICTGKNVRKYFKHSSVAPIV